MAMLYIGFLEGKMDDAEDQIRGLILFVEVYSGVYP